MVGVRVLVHGSAVEAARALLVGRDQFNRVELPAVVQEDDVRDRIGEAKVDASSVLFNGQQLNGAGGLKRFLLEHRQDQFARALTHKLTTYALGRPLSFADRASVERITRQLRRDGDGLATLIYLIVASDLFRSR